MKKNGFLIIITLLINTLSLAQVGIGTNTPSSKSILDLTATSKGLLLPRMSTAQRIAIAPTATSDKSMQVFDTTTNTIWFWNGTFWIEQGIKNIYDSDGTIGAGRAVSVTDNVNFDNNTFYIDGTNNKVGIGTTIPIAKLDIRSNPTAGTVNPGEGMLAIGSTLLSPYNAGAGAMKYENVSGGQLWYSNGQKWNLVAATINKSIVTANKQNSFAVNDQTVTNILNWSEVTDINSDFDPATGIFTAPRDGNYVVSFSFTFDSGMGNYILGSWIEAIITKSDGTRMVSSVPVPNVSNAYAGSNVTFTVRLLAGQTVRPTIYQWSGSQKWIRIDLSGFNNFSVVEL